ncbi:MAG: hypothetical protein RMI91_13960 [Gemmatales bacterium]|nr:hypothetical protein [Gemmatales bacterium]MDW7995750.1 hypothetical protein [Gemmatales bacterium]
MSYSTRFLLIVLRLAIGWHLLIEGYVKLHSLWTGPTETNRPFTSRYYLQQSVGPFRGFFLWIVGGDPDENLLARLSVEIEGGQARLSPQLRQYYEAYLKNFARTFQIDETLLAQLREKLQQHEQIVANWLAHGEEEWAKPTAWYPVKKKQRVPEWLAEYRQLAADLHTLRHAERRYFERPVGQERADRLSSEIAWYRQQFSEALAQRTQGLLKSWYDLLPADKKTTALSDVPEPSSEPVWLGRSSVWWVDRTTAWGLTLSGSLLLFGLLSRLAAWLGCGLLMLFYLCQPPLPWVPSPERTEGYYLYINKTLIEALALAVLGLVPTGRWFGLDGLLNVLWRRRARSTPTSTPTNIPSSTSPGPPVPQPDAGPPRRESS